MDLHQYGDAIVVQPVEHVHPPQRAPAVEGHAGDVGDGLFELPPVARWRQDHAPHVVVEVEVRILDPDRVMEPERDFHDSSPERRQQRQARPDRVAELSQGQRVAGGPIEEGDLQRVHVERRRLHVEKPSVEPTQTLHSGEYRALCGRELPSAG